ncbi:CETN2, partial [Symbiodinium sp. KB8]
MSAAGTGSRLTHPDFALTSRRRRVRPKLTDEQKQEVKEAFDLFDSEHTGKIDYYELKTAMRALGFPVKKAEVKSLMSSYDIDGTGKIEYSDFVDIMTEKYAARDPEEEIRKAFALFDEEGNGKITLK